MTINDKDNKYSVKLTRLELESLLGMLGYYLLHRDTAGVVELAIMVMGVRLGARLKRRLQKSFAGHFAITMDVSDMAVMICMFNALEDQVSTLGVSVRCKVYDALA